MYDFFWFILIRNYTKMTKICQVSVFKKNSNSVHFQIYQVLTGNPSELARPNIIVIFEISSHQPLHVDDSWKPYISHILLVCISKVCQYSVFRFLFIHIYLYSSIFLHNIHSVKSIMTIREIKEENLLWFRIYYLTLYWRSLGTNFHVSQINVHLKFSPT